jgi:hypothetical protein
MPIRFKHARWSIVWQGKRYDGGMISWRAPARIKNTSKLTQAGPACVVSRKAKNSSLHQRLAPASFHVRRVKIVLEVLHVADIPVALEVLHSLGRSIGWGRAVHNVELLAGAKDDRAC